MIKVVIVLFQVLILSNMSFAQEVSGTWEGTETAVCFNGDTGEWSTKINLTKVTFTPDQGSSGQYGSYTASPAFLGLPQRSSSSTERCTTAPTGISKGRYFISGNRILNGVCETEGSCSFQADYSFSLVRGKMIVSSGIYTYSLTQTPSY